MDFRDLSYFETIADTGHLGIAADKLCRTQSALSKSIARLEAELGADLFERTGRRLVLTPLGVLLVERARILRRGMEDTKRQLSDFSRGITGHVRLGASTTMAELLLPAVTSRFLARAPDVTMQLQIGMNDMLRDSLQAGHIDLMLGPLEGDGDGGGQGSGQAFVSHPVMQDEVVVVAGPDHPVFSGPMDIAELARYRWVLASGQVSTRRWLDATLQAAGQPPAVVQVESNSLLFLPPLMVRNQLLSMLSRRHLGAGRAGHPLREVPIPGTLMQRTFGVLLRDDSYLSPATICLLNILKSEGAALAAGKS